MPEWHILHGARLDDPVRTKPTTAKQNTPVPEEVKSLERYELEKQTKLLINLPEELKSGRSRGMSSRSRQNC